MDWLYGLGPEELLRFFRCHKTELSCMENPHIFINQLRDHNLIPEDKYKRMIRMKSKDNMKQTLYEVLDWLEKEQSQFIKGFWMCVFKEPIIFHYPTLRMLRNSLMDGSFHFGTQLPENVEKEETEKRKRNELSGCEEEDEREENSVKKKTKLRNSGTFEEEQASTSSPSAPSQRRKSNKICLSAEGEDENENEESDPDKEDQAASSSKESSTDVTGSFHFGTQLPENVEKEETEKGKRNELSGCEEKDEREENSVKKKRKLRNSGTFEEEQASTSSPSAPSQRRKSNKICFSVEGEDENENEESDPDKEDQAASSSKESSTDVTDEEGEMEKQTEKKTSPLKKGEKNDIWTRPMYKLQLPVTCGKEIGMLNRDKMAKGEKCIMHKKLWFTPGQFERLAGKQSYKNWKLSIRYRGNPLRKLIQEGHLKSTKFKRECKKAMRSLFPSDDSTTAAEGEDENENEESDPDKEDQAASSSKESSTDVTDEEGEMEKQTEQQPEASHGGSKKEDQKNDDECFICKSEQEPFVVCDQCPRSFHQNCHLPHIGDNIMGDGALWLCTFCVYRSNIELYFRYKLTREAAMSLQISQRMLECQYLLLHLWGADKEQTFATNPGLDLPDYSTVIKTPMWLGNIADKLQRQLYQTVGEFVSDVQLIFTNCATYNRENAEFLAKGDRLKKLFDKEWKNMFNICD